MNGIRIVLILLGLLIAPVFADYQMEVEYQGECPPDNTVELRCTDIGSGTVYISQTINLNQQYTFMIPQSTGTVVCIVECNGEEVYRKRYEYPGTKWKAVQGYPHDITRAGDQPPGAFIGTSDSVIIRSSKDCGNGEEDPGESCDTGGNKGCDDPLKPACYNCEYCGCSDARQCVQISGSMNCGDHGCPPWSYPKFTTLCLDGICAYKRECIVDQDCIDKHFGDEEKNITETNETKEPTIEHITDAKNIENCQDPCVVVGDIGKPKPRFSALIGAELEKDALIEPPLKDLIGNEKVNFYAGNETAYVHLKDGVIIDAGDGEMEGNTVNVITDEKTLDAIESGQLSVIGALDQNRIIIEGEGLIEGIKWAILNFLYDMSRMLDF